MPAVFIVQTCAIFPAEKRAFSEKKLFAMIPRISAFYLSEFLLIEVQRAKPFPLTLAWKLPMHMEAPHAHGNSPCRGAVSFRLFRFVRQAGRRKVPFIGQIAVRVKLPGEKVIPLVQKPS